MSVVLGVDPVGWTMLDWGSYHNRKVTILACPPYHPCVYRTLICWGVLRPGPIYQLDCRYSFQLDGRRLISLIQIVGLCPILRPDCHRAAIGLLQKPIGDGVGGGGASLPGPMLFQSPGPTIGSLILNISSLTTRLTSRTTDPDGCCNPRSHMPTDKDPTRWSSRVGIWDRAFKNTLSMGVSERGSANVQQITTPDKPIGLRFLYTQGRIHDFVRGVVTVNYLNVAHLCDVFPSLLSPP